MITGEEKQIHYVKATYETIYAVYCEETQIQECLHRNWNTIKSCLQFVDYEIADNDDQEVKFYDEESLPLTLNGDIDMTVAECKHKKWNNANENNNG